MIRSQEAVDKRTAMRMPAEEVFARFQEETDADVEVSFEDCRLTEDDLERLTDTDDPVNDYIGYGMLQRMMLAEAHARRRMENVEQAAGPAGRAALELVAAEAA